MDSGENRAVDAAIEALRPLEVSLDRLPTPRGTVLALRTGDVCYYLRPVWAGEGYPEDVRRAIEALAPTN